MVHRKWDLNTELFQVRDASLPQARYLSYVGTNSKGRGFGEKSEIDYNPKGGQCCPIVLRGGCLAIDTMQPVLVCG